MNHTLEWTHTPNDQIASQTVRFGDPTLDQTTTFEHRVTLATSLVASHSLLHRKIYPDQTADIFDYNRQDNLIRKETEGGTVHEYKWDGLGRLVDDRAIALAPDIDGTVTWRQTRYNTLGLAEAMIAGRSDAGALQPLSECQRDYDDYGALWREWQEHDGLVRREGSKPTVPIIYDRSHGFHNTHRLVKFRRGKKAVATVVGYGDSGGIDEQLSRVTTAGWEDETLPAVVYEYLGVGSLVRKTLPIPDVRLDLVGSTPGTYEGLDRFGRNIDQRWLDGSSNDLVRLQGAYSPDGLRLWRADLVATALGKSFDELYTYDGLDQIARFRRGTLDPARTSIVGSPTQSNEWEYDAIGNWLEFRSEGTEGFFEQTRSHNDVNEITSISNDQPPLWTSPQYDADGQTIEAPQANDPTKSFRYHYDAWGNVAETYVLDVSSNESRVLRHFYDGVNRRIRSLIYEPTSGAFQRQEDFYFDDRWRVIETFRQTVVEQPGKRYTRNLWSQASGDYLDTLIRRDRATAPNSDNLDESLYALQDAHASPVAIIDSNGAVQERFTFEAFGKPTFLSATYGPTAISAYDWKILFTGYRLDVEYRRLSR